MVEVGFGICGCGGVSDVHAQAIQSIPGARLIGFHNRTRSRAEQQAERYGVSWDLDLDRFLKRPGMDAVSICTPSGTHGHLGMLAAQAGKHVMVEKPIEVNLEKGRRPVGSPASDWELFSSLDFCRQFKVFGRWCRMELWESCSSGKQR